MKTLEKGGGIVTERMAAMPKKWLYFTFFLTSGFCGLLYEIVWLRLSMAEFGVTTAMVSIVLSMFMAGLGVGSWGAGALMKRLKCAAPAALRFYACAELLVGVSSLLVAYQLKWGHALLLRIGSGAVWQSAAYYWFSGLWMALTLVPWCTCMGATFPLLMTVIRESSASESERSFSYLYVANVLGALLGTTVSAFLLIEMLGFRRTLYVAGVLNAALALTALAVSFCLPLARPASSLPAERTVGKKLYGLPAKTILWMLFTTGLVSMAMEVVWIRMFTPYVGNVVYAFAAILAIYLGATFLGSGIYRLWARADRTGAGTLAWGFLALLGLLPLAAADPFLPPIGNLPGFVAGVLRVAAGILPFCTCLGFITPMLVDRWSAGDPNRAGKAYAINIAGSILGPLLAGFCILPGFGENWGLAALSVPLFILGGFAALLRVPVDDRARVRFFVKPVYSLMVLAGLLLAFRARAYETQFSHRLVRRDYVATVMATGTGRAKGLLVNGVGMTQLTPVTKFMADLPLASLRRAPRNGLVICFGMGTTYRSMLSWGIHVTAVDLVPSVTAVFGYFHPDGPRLMRSPLAQVVVDDGRRFLDGSNVQYDVITVDPPPPIAAPGSSLLYSREFCRIVKRHLRHDGVAQIWFPGGDVATQASIAKALAESFPYVRAFSSVEGWGVHFLVGLEPLAIPDGRLAAARVPAAAAADLLEWGPESTVERQFDRVI